MKWQRVTIALIMLGAVLWAICVLMMDPHAQALILSLAIIVPLALAVRP